MTSLAERMNKLPEARRKKVEKRAKALIAGEMSLQDLRKARKQTQMRVAQQLGINQENVSRIEKRSDLLLSTLELGGGISQPSADCADRHCNAGQGSPASKAIILPTP